MFRCIKIVKNTEQWEKETRNPRKEKLVEVPLVSEDKKNLTKHKSML